MPTLRNSAVAFNISATSITASAFTTAGSDRLGLVKIGWFTAGDISDVTWGGTSIVSNVIENNAHDASDRKRLLIFYMLNPPTGASDVVVTKAGVATAMSMIVEAWDGVDQVTPWADKVVTAAASEETANPAIKTSTAANGKVITDVFFMWSSGTPAGTTWTLGADQTQIQANLRDFGGGSNTGFFGSSYATSDGSVDMSWDTDHGPTNRWAMCIISLTAAPSGQQPGFTVRHRTYRPRPFAPGIAR